MMRLHDNMERDLAHASPRQIPGESGGPEGEVAMPVEVVSFDLDDTLWSTK